MDEELRSELAKMGISNNSSSQGLSTKADDYVNSQELEQLWAIKAMKYAEAHMKLLNARDGKELRLTKYDDEMYEYLITEFKDMEVGVVNIDEIKSESSKSKWRICCEKYNGLVTDYNFATLLRTDSSKDYSEDNTFIVPRIQFLAIEVARNRLGLNSSFYTPSI